MKKFLSFLAVAALAVFAFNACEQDPVQTDIPLEGISVAPASHSLKVGETVVLTATYNPQDASVKPEILWSSSKPEVATVDARGTVTAVAAGEAEIVATADKFTAKCVITVTSDEVVPQDSWDYTPGAAYGLDDNLWKAVDAAHTLAWYYNPNWAGEKPAPEVTFKESTYKFTIPDDTSGDWQAQIWIVPSTDLILDATKTYTFTCKVGATKETPVFFKMYEKGVDWPLSFESATNPRLTVGPDAILEIKAEDFVPITTPQSLLIDLGGAAAGTTVYIKDITLVVTGVAPAPQPEDTWDYTPSAEYLAETNLWKPLFDGNFDYIYGVITNNQVVDITAASNVQKKESTYKLTFPDATEGEWGCCNFLAPTADHLIPLAAGKKYRLSVTVGATAAIQKFIFSLHDYNAGAENREGDWKTDMWDALEANTPKTFTTTFNCTADMNVAWTIIPQFGTPAGMVLYIKDLIIEELVPSVPAELAGTYMVTNLKILGGLYTTKIEEFKDKSWEWNSSINNEYDNLLVVDADDCTVDYQAGADGKYWDRILVAGMNKLETGELDLSANFDQLPHEKVPLSVDMTTGTVTIGGTVTAQAYLPGDYTLSNDWSSTTGSISVPAGSIALAFKCANMPQDQYTWTDDWLYKDFDRFVIHPFAYIMIFAKQE